jgi:hypothetical protein
MYENYDDPKIMTEHRTVPYFDMVELKQFPFATHLCFNYKKKRKKHKQNLFAIVDWGNVITWSCVVAIMVSFAVMGYFVATTLWRSLVN